MSDAAGRGAAGGAAGRGRGAGGAETPRSGGAGAARHWLPRGAGVTRGDCRLVGREVAVVCHAAPAACVPEAEAAARGGWAMAREKLPEAVADAEGTPERSYREQLDYLNPIAQPLASRKLTRKLYKCIRKGLAGAGAWWGLSQAGRERAVEAQPAHPRGVLPLQRPSTSRSAAE